MCDYFAKVVAKAPRFGPALYDAQPGIQAPDAKKALDDLVRRIRTPGASGGLFRLEQCDVAWTRPRLQPGALMADVLYANTDAMTTGPTHVHLLDPEGGTERQKLDGKLWFVGLVANRQRLLALETRRDGQGLALLDAQAGFEKVWSRTAPQLWGDPKEIVMGDASSDGLVHVGGGHQLLALSEASGETAWSVDLRPLGGPAGVGKWDPMVSACRLVVATANATVALEAATGKLVWSLPLLAARAVYDGRVYLLAPGERYTIVDLRSGEILRDVRIGEALRKAAGEPVEYGTRLAVSDTHVFFGDLRGRLWAIERETGKPAWFDRPPGAQMFLGVIPVISDGRLHIGSIVLPPQKGPTYLYCYEETDAEAEAARAGNLTSRPVLRAAQPKADTKRAAPATLASHRMNGRAPSGAGQERRGRGGTGARILEGQEDHQQAESAKRG